MNRMFGAILITFVLCLNLFSQNKDLISAANNAVKAFTWDIHKETKGSLMFLDVPFNHDNKNNPEYLTLTVAKTKSVNRPVFISLIISNNIVQSNGILISFSKTVQTKNGKWNINLDKKSSLKINFEKCGKTDCTARIVGGYAVDKRTGKNVDVFQKFLDYDHVYFLFTYSNGTNESVSVPLFSFKKQYKTLL